MCQWPANKTVSTSEDVPLNFSSGAFTFTDVEGDALVSAQLTNLNLNGGTLDPLRRHRG